MARSLPLLCHAIKDELRQLFHSDAQYYAANQPVTHDAIVKMAVSIQRYHDMPKPLRRNQTHAPRFISSSLDHQHVACRGMKDGADAFGATSLFDTLMAGARHRRAAAHYQH